MIRDALVESNSKFDFISKIYDPEEYYKLNDNIIYEIEHSKEPELKKARALIKRIRTR